MAMIKIYDEQTQNTNYIINSDNVCYVKHYITTKTDEKKNKDGLDYNIEIHLVNGENLVLYFKTSESFNHYLDQFKNLDKILWEEYNDKLWTSTNIQYWTNY